MCHPHGRGQARDRWTAADASLWKQRCSTATLISSCTDCRTASAKDTSRAPRRGEWSLSNAHAVGCASPFHARWRSGAPAAPTSRAPVGPSPSPASRDSSDALWRASYGLERVSSWPAPTASCGKHPQCRRARKGDRREPRKFECAQESTATSAFAADRTPRDVASSGAAGPTATSHPGKGRRGREPAPIQ
jgi:hypothetical protein